MGIAKGERAARLAELIAMAGLSGRERERRNLRAAEAPGAGLRVVHRPRMLFLGEPTGG